MHVDRGAFLMFVTSLALGGGAGYVASEKDLVPHLDGKPPRGTPSPAPSAEPPRAVVVDAGPPVATVVDAGPACDDSVGEPGACPPPGLPTVEGGCGLFPVVRCNDFKKTMKPRVAKAAIACLNKLNGAERCDPKRVDLCAHLALMNACEDMAPTSTAIASCDSIARACASAPVEPSVLECRRSMAGLSEIGRDAMLDCAKKHCFDRGVLGCEAAAVPKP